MNVYPTGRQGAGVRDGDGRSGGSQWNQIEGLVHRSLAAKGRCLGKFGTGRRAHVGRTANMLLIPRMPRRMQPDSVCDVGDRHAEKQSRGDQDTGKQRRALGEACWAACECLRRTATGDGLRQDGGGGAGGAGGVAPARAPSCTPPCTHGIRCTCAGRSRTRIAPHHHPSGLAGSVAADLRWTHRHDL